MALRKCLKDAVVYNERSLSTLARAITLSEGDFSLLLAHCNSAITGQEIVKRLREISQVKLRELSLPPSAKTLYTTVVAELGKEQPSALIIFGLDSMIHLEPLLIATNTARNKFRETFHFPLILWVTDDVLRKMIRIAPDFYSWSTSIHFEPKTGDWPNLEQNSNSNQIVKEISSQSPIPFNI
ncbi:MAG: hypothetical protein ACM37W_04495 [Actinomycetota bacterium]